MSGTFEWKRRVFVVMPFGTKEVPRRARIEADSSRLKEECSSAEKLEVDFDAVYQELFVPALKKIGCEPFRADQEGGAGDIRKDMFFELITADVVLADISILNANVFYELGVRHTVGPRGALAVHAGWSDRPFDVAPDRTFRYEGRLFVKGASPKERSEQEMTAAVDQLAKLLEKAIAEDDQKTGSPVYSLIDGLKPLDYSQVKTDRARYFGAIHEEWRDKVEIARRQQNAGDILTLAEDMPTRLYRKALLWDCARALVALHRFNSANRVLDELLEMDRENFQAKCLLELVHNRLGRREQAEVNLSSLVTQRKGDGEAQGMLGRVYKDLWRSSWEREEDITQRREKALASEILLRHALESYRTGFETNLENYFNGINFLSLLYLCKAVGGNFDLPISEAEAQDTAAAIRLACHRDIRRRKNEIWAWATLGESALLEGKGEEAKAHYNRASRAPDVSYFDIDSMLTQVQLFDCLGFQNEAVALVVGLLKARAQQLGSPKTQFRKVVLASGHMIDKPDRAQPRFPERLEEQVREQIAARLKEGEIGSQDLALCGGACGSDILFAEECIKVGAQLRLMLALPLEKFIARSVSFAGSRWVRRLKALMDNTAQCQVAYQHERIGRPPVGTSPFTRNNIWEINTARAQDIAPTDIHAILVWDEKTNGDGPGGTSDLANRVRSLGGLVSIINPSLCKPNELK